MITATELELDPLNGEGRPLSDWLTTFPLACVVLDPFTHQSAWLLDTSKRILKGFREADCRGCWILTCSPEDARRFLGPYAEEILTFSDPSRAIARGLGIESAPCFLLVRQDGVVTAKAEGWDPDTWRDVAEAIADLTHWSRPQIPADGDPAPFPGTPISG